MAKVDITKIEGYEGMTPEEKIKALEAYEIEDVQPDYSGYVKKDVFDKTASELAGVKKQLKEKMTDDEAAKQKVSDMIDAICATAKIVNTKETGHEAG